MEIDGEEERSSWFVEVYKNSNAEAEATLSKTEMRPLAWRLLSNLDPCPTGFRFCANAF